MSPKLTQTDTERLYYEQLGKKLIALRHTYGMSQEQMAQYINIATQQFQKYEKGTNRISVFKLALLLRHFDLSVDEFCNMENMPLSKPKKSLFYKRFHHYATFCDHAESSVVNAVNTIMTNFIKQEFKE